jgi:Fur family zinc uptake transcriptional regulator
MSAYDVMEHLRPQGVRAPTTVYRSLNRLMHLGLVHRLESLNAFVPCAHDGDHAGLFFAICESCGSVAEFTDTLIDEQLAARAKTAQFSVHQATLELKGQCRACMQVAKRQPDLS